MKHCPNCKKYLWEQDIYNNFCICCYDSNKNVIPVENNYLNSFVKKCEACGKNLIVSHNDKCIDCYNNYRRSL